MPEISGGPGRPRSAQSWSAILDAAADLLESDGYLRLSLDAVAAKAGVSKRTIYRWWPSKGRLVIEAYLMRAADRLTVPDTGDLRADLAAYTESFAALLTTTATARAVAGLIAASFDDADLSRTFRQEFLGERRSAAAQIFTRAIARGDLPPTASVEHLLDAFFAPLWYRALFTGAPLDAAFAASHVDRVLSSR